MGGEQCKDFLRPETQWWGVVGGNLNAVVMIWFPCTLPSMLISERKGMKHVRITGEVCCMHALGQEASTFCWCQVWASLHQSFSPLICHVYVHVRKCRQGFCRRVSEPRPTPSDLVSCVKKGTSLRWRGRGSSPSQTETTLQDTYTGELFHLCSPAAVVLGKAHDRDNYVHPPQY